MEVKLFYVSLHINDTINTNVNVQVISRTELPKYKEGITILGNKILDSLNKLGIQNIDSEEDLKKQQKQMQMRLYLIMV